MDKKRKESLVRLLSFVFSAGSGSYGALCFVASYTIAWNPNSGWNTMVAIFIITGVFSIALSLSLLLVARPWRKDFGFYLSDGKDDETNKRLKRIEEKLGIED